MTIPSPKTILLRHTGPPLWLPAIMFAVLFNVGLYFVTTFSGNPAFPGPWEAPDVIATFFRTRPSAALMCGTFQFVSAIPLGIYTATAVSRLQFLGVRAAGAHIVLFGGFATALNMMASSAVLWAMAFPEIADDLPLVHALYRLLFVLGGVGFSVPLGLLIAGISLTSLAKGLLPKWIVFSGLFLAIVGELSWLDLLFPQALFLIPLTRFPGFVWLIIVGFVLPTTDESRRSAG